MKRPRQVPKLRLQRMELRTLLAQAQEFLNIHLPRNWTKERRRQAFVFSIALMVLPLRQSLDSPPAKVLYGCCVLLLALSYVAVYHAAQRQVRSARSARPIQVSPSVKIVSMEEGLGAESDFTSSGEEEGPLLRGIVGQLGARGGSSGEDHEAMKKQTAADLERRLEDVALLQEACDQALEEQEELKRGMVEAHQRLQVVETERKQLAMKLEAVRSEIPHWEDASRKTSEALHQVSVQKDLVLTELRFSEERLVELGKERDAMAASQAKLGAELEQCKAEAEAASETVKQAVAHKDTLVNAVATARDEMARLTEERGKIETEQAELRANICRLEAEVAEVQAATTRTREEQDSIIADLRRERADAEVREMELREKQTALQAEVDKSFQESTELRAALEADAQRQEVLARGLAEDEERLRDAQNRHQELQDRQELVAAEMRSLEKQVVEVKASIQEVREEKDQLATDVKAAQAQLDTTTAEHRELQAELHSSTQTLQEMQSEVQKTGEEQERLRSGLAAASKELQRVEEDNTTMKTKQGKLQAEIDVCTRQMANAKAGMQSALVDKDTLKSEVLRCSARLSATEEEATAMQKQQSEAQEQLRQCQSEASQLRTSLDDMTTKRDCLSSEFQSATEETARLKVEQAAMLERQGALTTELKDCTEGVVGAKATLDETSVRCQRITEDLRANDEKLRSAQEERLALAKEQGEIERQILSSRREMDTINLEVRVVKEAIKGSESACAQVAEDRKATEAAKAAAEALFSTVQEEKQKAETEMRNMSEGLWDVREQLKVAEARRDNTEEEARMAVQKLKECAGEVAALRSGLKTAEGDRKRLMNAVEELRRDFDDANDEREALKHAQEVAGEKLAECAGQVNSLRAEMVEQSSEARSRLDALRTELNDVALSTVREEVAPLKRDVEDLQRRVDGHAEMLNALQLQSLEKATGEFTPSSSRSVSLYEGSDNGRALSSCGVLSSGASTPRGSRGSLRNSGASQGRILRGTSFCSSAGSESGGSSVGSKPILAGRSFTSSDAGDDALSVCSLGQQPSGSAISAGSAALPRPSRSPPVALQDEEVMTYAQAVKPLIVTRKDLARVLSRVPEAVLLGPAGNSKADGYAEIRELLHTIFQSIVAVVHVPGKGDVLAFASGLTYNTDGAPYSLGRLSTTMQLKGTPCFVAPTAQGRRPAPVPEGDAPAAQASTLTETQSTELEETLEARLADVSSRDLFLAELVGPFGAVLKAAALDVRCTAKALRHRRHQLRHAKEALAMALRIPSEQP